MKKQAGLSEEYIVRYAYQDTDGFWKEGEISAWSAGRSDHEEVERVFLRKHPSWKIKRITYV